MRNYFIRYSPEAKINYLYLFMLYGLADYNKDTRTYSTITFDTKKELAERLTATYKKYAFSYATLTRIIANDDYNSYFTVDSNKIILNNRFSRYVNTDNQPFVIITSDEANFLIKSKDNLLAKYYCYLKYYCGLTATAGKIQDFTAKQFLSSIGLSTNNHDNLNKISKYNSLLVEQGYIKIEKYRDKLGHERNIYTIL